jgi:hypothetical protein
MDKRGPKRMVVNAVKVGEYGSTSWHVELECTHTTETKRKPKVQEDKLCCKSCLATLPVSVQDDPWIDAWVEYDPMEELRAKATIASKVGVPIDQVEFFNGTATVFIDAQQVKRLL